MSAILSFLGGSAFRLVWGQISEYLTEKQNHKHELERIRLQGELDDAQHERNQAAIKLQAELGVQTIRVQGEADTSRLETEGWAQAVATATKPSGIWFVDFLNGMIRPTAACIAIYLWVAALNAQGFKMTDWDRELVGVILGFYFATRIIQNRGK
jgi:hypothetical protein